MAEFFYSILVLSTQPYCERLKKCILHTSKILYEKEIKVTLAENVLDILNSEKPNVEVDFVAIVVDTSIPNAVKKCERDISLITPFFLVSRICIVNGACRNGSTDIARDLIKLADKYGIPFFNGQIADDLSCRVVAERIMKLATISSGYVSGISEIIPTIQDLGLIV